MIKSIEKLIDVGHYIRVALNLAHFELHLWEKMCY